MKQMVKAVVVLVLVAMIAVPLAAQEQGKKRAKRPSKPSGPEAQLMKKLEPLNVTADQKEKIKTILASFKPKFEKLAGTLKVTPEQRKAADEARKAGQAEGKKGKDLQKVVRDAMKLSDDQVTSRQKQQELNRQLHKEVAEVLTAEQREKFVGKRPDAEPKKNRNK